jgi:Holliday junction resolvase RusA-like endonuclease
MTFLNPISFKFTIPGRPPAKSNSYRIVRIGKFSKLVPTALVVAYEKTVEDISKEQVELFKLQTPLIPEGEIAVSLIWHKGDKRRKDLDNIAKAIKDGMTTGGIWSDDSQVTSLFLRSVIDAPSVYEEWVDVYVAQIPSIISLNLTKKSKKSKKRKSDISNAPDAQLI